MNDTIEIDGLSAFWAMDDPPPAKLDLTMRAHGVTYHATIVQVQGGWIHSIRDADGHLVPEASPAETDDSDFNSIMSAIMEVFLLAEAKRKAENT